VKATRMHGHGRDREESRGITRVGLVLDGPGPDCQSERMHVKVAIWWRIASGGEARRVPIYIYTSRLSRIREFAHATFKRAHPPRASEKFRERGMTHFNRRHESSSRMDPAEISYSRGHG